MDPSKINLAFLGAVISVSITLSFVSLIIALVTRAFHIKTNRPALITVICAFWAWVAIGFIQRVISTFSLIQLPVNVPYPAAIILSVIGLWKMKK